MKYHIVDSKFNKISSSNNYLALSIECKELNDFSRTSGLSEEDCIVVTKELLDSCNKVEKWLDDNYED